MTIELHIKIEPDFIPVNLCIETARYLLAIADIDKPKSEEKLHDDLNSDYESDTDECVSSGNDLDVEKIPLPPEVDITGAPWDYRIHSTNKSKTAEGKWRVKRNVGEKLVSKVTEDNKTAMESSPITAPPVTDLFPDFMKVATAKISTGKLNHLSLVKMLKEKGIPDIPSVKIRQDLIPGFIEEIEKL